MQKCRLISSPFCSVSYTIPVQFKSSAISTGVSSSSQTELYNVALCKDVISDEQEI